MSIVPDYDFAKLAKSARREEGMRRIVYGKKVTAGTMKEATATAMTEEMSQIAEVLERLAEWKAKKTQAHVQPADPQ